LIFLCRWKEEEVEEEEEGEEEEKHSTFLELF